MGIQGTEVVKEGSDIIILDDNFASVVKVNLLFIKELLWIGVLHYIKWASWATLLENTQNLIVLKF